MTSSDIDSEVAIIEKSSKKSDSNLQSVDFASVIQDILSVMNANVETSKFSIEKTTEGTWVDVAFSATIKSKNNPKSS
jgi:hypothetical protein